MIEKDSEVKGTSALLIIGIIFIAFNLRPAITSVGPLVVSIRDYFGINNLEAGFLTTIPLVAFAVISPFVAKISRRIGNELTLQLALLVLISGILIRYIDQLWLMYLGTLIVGAGIAVSNVLLPGIIKADFPKKIGLMTSIYTTAMCAMAGLASGISIPISDGAGLGWQNTLLIWAILAIIGSLLWLPQLRNNQKSSTFDDDKSDGKSIWNSSMAWWVTVFMGLQSFLFYCIIAWLPSLLQSKGMSDQLAGWMLLFVQIIGLPATFFVPIIALRLKRKEIVVVIIGLMNMLGFGGLLLFNHPILLVASIGIFGLSMGGSISLAFAIISLRSKNSRQANELSGMAQSIGYLLAATGPVLLGFVFDRTGSWLMPLLIIQFVNLGMFISGMKSVHRL